MYTAKVFVNGGSQAVRLPKQFRFSDDEIYVKKIGDSILLVPKDKLWETFLEGVDGFTEDYFEAVEDRVEAVEEREGL
ncbi:MAG: type II toxin-antitoxin system VapB family antitoxin [Ruminiclostridium sp.]|nr:type II toxin-antitoxin system VapB family antitoxin [Ruminiclostridium sp.]